MSLLMFLQMILRFFEGKNSLVNVGQNFRFGKVGKAIHPFHEVVKNGMNVQVVNSKNMGEVAGSSRIREALIAGQIESVNQMLGRNYRIYGSVFPGRKWAFDWLSHNEFGLES